MKPNTTVEMQLECIVDDYNLGQTLHTLSNICFEKGAHIRASYSDDGLAKLWEGAGAKLQTLANKTDI